MMLSTSPESQPDVVIYVQPFCPFCARAEKLYRDLGCEPVLIDTTLPENQERYQRVVQETQHFTVPVVFVKGKYVGGCDDSCAMAGTGKLQRLLDLPTFNAKIPDQRPAPRSPGLLLFPPIANRWVVQGTAIIVVILSIIIIVWRKESWAWWVTFAMTLDFIVRFAAGASVSMAGSAAMFFQCFLTEEFVPGPPKQFAAFIGVIFFGFATILFHAGHGDTSEIGGSIVVGTVMGFAALEGFLNFCAGCFVFSYLVKWGIISELVYRPYTDLIETFVYTRNLMDSRKGLKELPGVTKDSIPSQDTSLMGWRRRIPDYTPTPIVVKMAERKNGMHSDLDLDYKFPKFDDTVREKFGPQYFQIQNFSIPLAISGFAAVLRYVNPVLHVPATAWHVVGIFAFSVYTVFLLGYLYKLVFFPRKVFMEFQNSMIRNGAVVVPITNLVFVMLIDGKEATLQQILFWSAVPAGMFLTLVCLYGNVKDFHHVDHIGPGMLFPACFPLLVALVCPIVGYGRPTAGGYMEAGQWFLGFGLLLFVIFLTIIMRHSITSHWSDDRQRGAFALVPGACFIAQLAYMKVNMMQTMDTIAFTLWSSGVFFFLVCVLLVFPGKWMLRNKFQVCNWAVAFPLDVFVLAAVEYRRAHWHPFSLGCLWVALIFTGWAHGTMFFHTLTLLALRRWPRPADQFAPLSSFKLQHEAMRDMVTKLVVEAEQPSDGMPNQFKRLSNFWSEFTQLARFTMEAKHKYLYPEMEGMLPEHVEPIYDQAERLQAKMKKADQAVTDNNLPALKEAILDMANDMRDHMQWIEDHLQPLSKKTFNLAMHHEILKNVWRGTPLSVLEGTFVTVIRHLPMHQQRIRYIRCFIWVLGERAQQIGRWLYLGLAKDPLGDAKYEMILEDIAEIAPRGSGWYWSKYI